MMRLISNLRLRLALLVCPELRASAPASGYADINLARTLAPARRLRQAGQLTKGPLADASILPLADVLATRRVNPGDRAAAGGQGALQVQSREAKPWADVDSAARAEAYLEGASEEELRVMAERLLAGRPVSRAEVVPQRMIALALGASERLSRRLTGALQAEKFPRAQSPSLAPDQGER
jgi:hypothetical protein